MELQNLMGCYLEIEHYSTSFNTWLEFARKFHVESIDPLQPFEARVKT